MLSALEQVHSREPAGRSDKHRPAPSRCAAPCPVSSSARCPRSSQERPARPVRRRQARGRCSRTNAPPTSSALQVPLLGRDVPERDRCDGQGRLGDLRGEVRHRFRAIPRSTILHGSRASAASPTRFGSSLPDQRDRPRARAATAIYVGRRRLDHRLLAGPVTSAPLQPRWPRPRGRASVGAPSYPRRDEAVLRRRRTAGLLGYATRRGAAEWRGVWRAARRCLASSIRYVRAPKSVGRMGPRSGTGAQ